MKKGTPPCLALSVFFAELILTGISTINTGSIVNSAHKVNRKMQIIVQVYLYNNSSVSFSKFIASEKKGQTAMSLSSLKHFSAKTRPVSLNG